MDDQGRSGDLVPIATSFDKSGRYGLQTPFSEGVSHLWKGSMWRVDAEAELAHHDREMAVMSRHARP